MSTQYFIGKYFPKIATGLFLAVCLASPVAAQATRMANSPTSGTWMSGEEIIAEYTDTTQTGMYSWTKENAPVSFKETHNDNTITTYNEYGKEDFTTKGVWIVKKNIICYYYKDWRMNNENCFTVLKSGNCYYHYDDLKEQNFEDMDNWNSVSYDENETPTCVPPIS